MKPYAPDGVLMFVVIPPSFPVRTTRAPGKGALLPTDDETIPVTAFVTLVRDVGISVLLTVVSVWDE